MKFMSFNIQHATDYIRQVIDLDYFAEEIRRLDPDFLGLRTYLKVQTISFLEKKVFTKENAAHKRVLQKIMFITQQKL